MASKRDLKQTSVSAYYRKLAASLNPDHPDTPLLASQYLKYADDYEKEEGRLLYKWTIIGVRNLNRRDL